MADGRDQRVRNRVRMDLQVRVRQIAPPRNLTEVTRTVDVSRNGVLFRTREPYNLHSTVWITMPYAPNALAQDPEFPATVVRIGRKPDGLTEVAVNFHSSRADVVSVAAPAYRPASTARTTDRRSRSRVRMALPVRLRHENATEESVTFDVSRGGVLVKTARDYPVGQTVWVVMPYKAGAATEEVPARVVRVVDKTEVRGIALHFTRKAESYSYARSFS